MSTSTGNVAKFLIVDDSRAIQSIIKRVIESCNYPKLEIQSASDAEAAMDILEKFKPDLIITDWHMHKISGLEFCQHVSQTYGGNIPIGFVTTESSQEKIELAYQSGAKFVINKPFQDVDLRVQLARFVPLEGAVESSTIQEISKLQSSLEEITQELRRGNYLSMDENAELAAMRKRIESYQSMVMKARAEAKESEGIMAGLKDEIARLSNVPAQTTAPFSSDNLALQDEVQVLTQEKQALEAKLAALQDEMRRNTIEKEFIEERFIGLS